MAALKMCRHLPVKFIKIRYASNPFSVNVGVFDEHVCVSGLLSVCKSFEFVLAPYLSNSFFMLFPMNLW